MFIMVWRIMFKCWVLCIIHIHHHHHHSMWDVIKTTYCEWMFFQRREMQIFSHHNPWSQGNRVFAHVCLSSKIENMRLSNTAKYPKPVAEYRWAFSWSIGNAEYQTILCGWKYPMLASCITKTLCTVLTTQFYVDVGYVTLHNTECMYTHVFSILILTAMIPD